MSDDPRNEALEALRRGLPLRMDARGRFLFEGDPVTHPRVVELFRRGLDVSESGEPIVRVGTQWAYLGVEDCPLRATGVRARGDELVLMLDDGREVELAIQALWEETGRGLRCQAPARTSGRSLNVRFTNRAQLELDAWLVWPDEARRPRLRIGDVDVEIQERAT